MKRCTADEPCLVWALSRGGQGIKPSTELSLGWALVCPALPLSGLWPWRDFCCMALGLRGKPDSQAEFRIWIFSRWCYCALSVSAGLEQANTARRCGGAAPAPTLPRSAGALGLWGQRKPCCPPSPAPTCRVSSGTAPLCTPSSGTGTEPALLPGLMPSLSPGRGVEHKPLQQLWVTAHAEQISCEWGLCVPPGMLSVCPPLLLEQLSQDKN